MATADPSTAPTHHSSRRSFRCETAAPLFGVLLQFVDENDHLPRQAQDTHTTPGNVERQAGAASPREQVNAANMGGIDPFWGVVQRHSYTIGSAFSPTAPSSPYLLRGTRYCVIKVLSERFNQVVAPFSALT